MTNVKCKIFVKHLIHWTFQLQNKSMDQKKHCFLFVVVYFMVLFLALFRSFPLFFPRFPCPWHPFRLLFMWDSFGDVCCCLFVWQNHAFATTSNIYIYIHPHTLTPTPTHSPPPTPHTHRSLSSLLAAILHLGNINFARKTDEEAQIENTAVIKFVFTFFIFWFCFLGCFCFFVSRSQLDSFVFLFFFLLSFLLFFSQFVVVAIAQWNTHTKQTPTHHRLVATLLSVEASVLQQAFLSRKIKVVTEIVTTPNNKAQAEDGILFLPLFFLKQEQSQPT